jgi:exopolyphosphatase/guanosine-5'-triphosphate,3'-diphosphate pyrophosphatase
MSRVRAMGFDFAAVSSGTAQALAAMLQQDRGGKNGTKRGDARGDARDDARVDARDDGPTLTVDALADLEQKLAGLTLNQRARLPGLDARRADTVLAGAVVLRTALELGGAPSAIVCESALREGIVADYIATHRPGMLLVEEFPDLRRRSVMELCRRCHYDEGHAQHVARLALSLFDQTRELHQDHAIRESDGELLEFAALLHDVGFYISPSKHHRHSQYLIQTHDMVGFSRADVGMMAGIARYHRKAEPPGEDALSKTVDERHRAFRDLGRRARRRVRYLTAVLRLADALDRTHGRLVRAVRCQVGRKTIELRIEVDGDPELELWAARRKGDLLESLAGRRLRLAVVAVNEAPRGLPSPHRPEFQDLKHLKDPTTPRLNPAAAAPVAMQPAKKNVPAGSAAKALPARRQRAVRLVRQ